MLTVWTVFECSSVKSAFPAKDISDRFDSDSFVNWANYSSSLLKKNKTNAII